MNVTMSIDERVVAEARRIAAARGTSLNQLVRDFLNELTRVDDAESVNRTDRGAVGRGGLPLAGVVETGWRPRPRPPSAGWPGRPQASGTASRWSST